MTKYARLTISGDNLSYRVTLPHFWAAMVIKFIATTVPEKFRLYKKPASLSQKVSSDAGDVSLAQNPSSPEEK